MTIEELKNKSIADAENVALSPEQVDGYISLFEFWGLDDQNRLMTNFELENFSQALALVNTVGELAEQEQHHPDIMIYEYNNVVLTLFTHDIEGLTEKDFVMAAKIESLFNEAE